MMRNKVRFGENLDVAFTVKMMDDWVEEYMGFSKRKASLTKGKGRKAEWLPSREGTFAAKSMQLGRMVLQLWECRFETSRASHP